MFEREVTPPISSRILSSSGSESPDSLYKSSTDSCRTFNLSLDDDSSLTRTSTVCRPLKPLPKFQLDDDSENEWDSSLASPVPKRPPSVKKACKSRSRISNSSREISQAFSPMSDDQENSQSIMASPQSTPPHKRLRALRINDLYNSSPSPSPLVTNHRSPSRLKKYSPRTSLFSNSSRKHARSPGQTLKKPSTNPFTPSGTPNRKARGRPSISDSGFSDDSWLLDVGKHNGLEMDTDDDDKLALQEMYTSRYKEEFCEECVIGRGEFGTVYKCLNKLDGCTYAIKKSREPVAGSAFERVARNEVYAHAVLGKHSHVVRYYSAWAENGHLYIQNEYCNGGTLSEEISLHKKRGTRFTEGELKDILKQMSHGLKYIHAQQLAHMDIKPANIFIQYNPLLMQSPESGIEDDSSDDSELNDRITYKIGDFGHVTSLSAEEIEEGDCRYLPKEILSDNYQHLSKADIFALGLVIYQAATLADLPKNGDLWHEIREGRLPYLNNYSSTLNSLVKNMVHPDPTVRPSAAVLASHPDLCPAALLSRKQLAQELSAEKYKNQLLAKKLKAVQENAELRHFNMPAIKSSGRNSRMVGIKVNRSKSLTNF